MVTESTETITSAPIDPDFLNALLGSVDVDMNDPLIQAALAQLGSTTTTSTTNANNDNNEKTSKKRKNENEDDK